MSEQRYIVKINNPFIGDGYYRFDEKSWTFVIVLDPNSATVFNDKNAALAWMRENTAEDKDQYRVVEFGKAVTKWEKWLKSGAVFSSKRPLRDQKFSRKYNDDAPEVVLDWHWLRYENENAIKYEDYKTWPDLFQVFKHLCDVSAFENEAGGFFKTVEIYVNQDSNFETFASELNLVYDRITFLDDDGFKVMPVFDRYLSEGGNKAYLKGKDGYWKVVIRDYKIAVEGTLKDCFDYLRKHRYYK